MSMKAKQSLIRELTLLGLTVLLVCFGLVVHEVGHLFLPYLTGRAVDLKVSFDLSQGLTITSLMYHKLYETDFDRQILLISRYLGPVFHIFYSVLVVLFMYRSKSLAFYFACFGLMFAVWYGLGEMFPIEIGE